MLAGWNLNQVGSAVNNIGDVWIIVSLVTLFLFIALVLDRPQLTFRRWAWIVGITFLTRATIVGVTRYARTLYVTAPYRPDNWFAGALLTLSRRYATATDFMFSGHTANWFIASWTIARYTYWGWFSLIYFAVNLVGVSTLILTEEHYLADILVGGCISTCIFWLYHAFLDVQARQQLRPGLDGLIATRSLHIVLPATIRGHDGALYRIGGPRSDFGVDRESMVLVSNGKQQKWAIETLPHGLLPGYQRRLWIWAWIKWLDAGE